jgi:hypothetical protein
MRQQTRAVTMVANQQHVMLTVHLLSVVMDHLMQ